MWRHIKPILQVIILVTTMLVSSPHCLALENTIKCPTTFHIVHIIIPNYNWVTRILAQTLRWNLKSSYGMNKKKIACFFVVFLLTVLCKRKPRSGAKSCAFKCVKPSIVQYFKSVTQGCIAAKSGQVPGGGTQIWKWRTSAYLRTKIGGLQCTISSKKGCHSVWAPKKWGLFWCGLPKWGLFSVQKCNFKAKFANSLLKLPQNVLNSQNACEAPKNLPVLCKIWYKCGKKGSHWVWTEF